MSSGGEIYGNRSVVPVWGSGGLFLLLPPEEYDPEAGVVEKFPPRNCRWKKRGANRSAKWRLQDASATTEDDSACVCLVFCQSTAQEDRVKGLYDHQHEDLLRLRNRKSWYIAGVESFPYSRSRFCRTLFLDYIFWSGAEHCS